MYQVQAYITTLPLPPRLTRLSMFPDYLVLLPNREHEPCATPILGARPDNPVFSCLSHQHTPTTSSSATSVQLRRGCHCCTMAITMSGTVPPALFQTHVLGVAAASSRGRESVHLLGYGIHAARHPSSPGMKHRLHNWRRPQEVQLGPHVRRHFGMPVKPSLPRCPEIPCRTGAMVTPWYWHRESLFGSLELSSSWS